MKKAGILFIFLVSIFSIGLSLRSVDFAKAASVESGKGGSVVVNADSVYTMTEGSITGSAATNGGAVLVSNGATFIMRGGTITGSAATNGGAIYVEDGGTCIILGGEIIGSNTTKGGTIFVAGGGTCIITGGQIRNGSATYGGGIYISKSSTCVITGGEITDCTAEYGPLIYAESGSKFECTIDGIDDSQIEDHSKPFVLGAVPTQVTVKRGDQQIFEGETLRDGEILDIQYAIINNYYMRLDVKGATRQGATTKYVVNDNVVIDYTQNAATSSGTYKLVEDHYEYRRDSTTTTIYIPNYYNNKPVTVIPTSAIKGTSCRYLYIPDTITTIGDHALSTSLYEVDVPDSVVSIGAGAFPGGSFTSIKMGSGVASLGNAAFGGSKTLVSIKISPENKTYTSQDTKGNECNCIIEISTKTLVRACATTKIPTDGSVTNITYGAFTSTEIGTFDVPEGVLMLGEKAFAGLSVDNLILPKSLTSLGASVISNSKANIFYRSTKADWERLLATGESNENLQNSTTYYFATTNPYLTNPSDPDLYWHYAEDKVTPVPWENPSSAALASEVAIRIVDDEIVSKKDIYLDNKKFFVLPVREKKSA